MELTKKILNICIAFGIVCLSLSALIYSARDSKAIAAPQTNSNEFEVVGVVPAMMDFMVIGYNRTTGNMKILARESMKELKD